MSNAQLYEQLGSDSFEEADTLVDVVCRVASRFPDRLAYRFLTDIHSADQVTLTYGALATRAKAVSARLLETNRSGDRVALLFPPGLEFIVAFYATLFAGLACVPLTTPLVARRTSAPPKLRGILEDVRPSFLLTTSRMLPAIKDWDTNVLGRLPHLAIDEIDSGSPHTWQRPDGNADTLCLLQYTSGSTSTPRGVMLTHGALLHNLKQIHSSYGITDASVGVSWLPHYHDMGLIGAVIQPLFSTVPVTLMSPLDFVRRPVRWLQTISDYRATISMAPNFAFELCVQRVTQSQRESLDLSSWETAGVGAEPVRAETLARFAEMFGPCGFRREAFLPCYGLAEATLLVSGHKPSAAATTRIFRVAELQQHHAVEATDGDVAPGRVLVSSGRPSPGLDVVIVDPETKRRCEDGQIGEIWVMGPNVGLGYWGRAEQSVETFGAFLAETGGGPFLRTGDLGFIYNGELFPTGRIKDLIIIDGRNHYPHDIESTVAQTMPQWRPTSCAAFSLDIDSSERLVVVVEADRGSIQSGNGSEAREPRDGTFVIQAIRTAVAREHDVQVYDVRLIKTGTLPRTSSGKPQRHACRQMYVGGAFEPARL